MTLTTYTEINQYDPDLVIIYMGHNEFYGAYGAASSISIGKAGGFSRFMLKLQKIHLYNGLNSLVRAFQTDKVANMDVTLMEKMVKERNIPLDSGIRQVTYQNYEKNLDLILNRFAKNKIPVIIGNLVSNIKDQPPLDQNRLLYEKGLAASSLPILIKAKDKDEIPFRAPSEINEIITTKAQQKKITLADIQGAFFQSADNGIPGNKLFCDHLHPNPVGYHLMAEEFFKTCQPLLPQKEKFKLSEKPKFVTQLEWEIGGLRVFKLEKKWPFYSQEKIYPGLRILDHHKVIEIAEDFLINHHIWGKAHSDLAAYYESIEEFYLASKEYEAILAMYPERLDYHLKLIDCAKRAREWKLVENTATKALALTSVKGMLYYNIGLAQRNRGYLKSAFEYVEKALETQQLTHDQLAYVFYLKALILSDIEEYGEAIRILDVITEEEPEFTPAKLLREKINKNMNG